MDYNNRSIPVDQVTSFDVNKAIQRSLTKAVARHGLGLYIYAGEDLPEDDNQVEQPSQPSTAVQARRTAAKRTAENKPSDNKPYEPMSEEDYWKIIKAYAEGRKTKTGGDYRSTWIMMTNAKEDNIREFDHNVENYRIANNL